MDELKVNIDLKPLTDEEIKQSHLTLGDLWMVKVPGKDPYGPYDTESLKEYAHTYQFLFENAQVYNLDEDQWFEMFKVSQFQRRKPQLVSVQNFIKDQDFYILSSGQKDGPYNQDDLQTLLDKGHILPSTQISLDAGKSWIKLYEHHAFDRRTKKSNSELPFKPNENILEKVQIKKEKILGDDAKDALVELAFIGETTSKIQLDKKYHDKTSTKHNIPKVISKSKRVKKPVSPEPAFGVWKIASVCFALLLAVGFYFNRPQTEEKNIKPIVEVKTNAKGIDNSGRVITKRAPASTDESYEERQKRSIQKMRRFKRVRNDRSKAPKRMIRKKKSRKSRPSRFVRKKDTFEQDIENIDINDPEIQHELSRQLAGEYEDEPQEPQEPIDDYDSRDEYPEEEAYSNDASPVEDDRDYDPYEQEQPREDDQAREHDNY